MIRNNKAIILFLLCLPVSVVYSKPVEFEKFFPGDSDQDLWIQALNIEADADTLLADSIFNLAYKKLKNGEDPDGSIMILSRISGYYSQDLNSPEKGKHILDISEEAYRKVADTVSFAFSYFYKTKAMYHHSLGNSNERLNYYQKAYVIIKRLDPEHAIMPNLLELLMKGNFEARNIEEGFVYYDSLLDYSKNNNDYYYKVSAYLNAGNILKFYNTGLAAQFFDYSFFLARQFNVREHLDDPFFYISTGSGKTAINEHREAKELYRKGFKKLLDSDITNHRLKLSFFYYLGVSHRHLGNTEKAINLLDSAAVLDKQLSGTKSPFYYRCKNITGRILNNAGRFEEAIPINIDVLDFYLEYYGKHNNYYTQHGILELGRSYGGAGKYKEALKLGQMGIYYFLELDVPDDIFELPELEHYVSPEKQYMELEYGIYNKIDVMMDMYTAEKDTSILPVIMDHFAAVMKVTDIHESVGQNQLTLNDLSSRYKFYSNRLIDYVFELDLPETYIIDAYLMASQSKSYQLLAEKHRNTHVYHNEPGSLSEKGSEKSKLATDLLSLNPDDDVDNYISHTEKLLALELDEFTGKISEPATTREAVIPRLADTRNMDIYHSITGDEMVLDFYVTKTELHTFVFTNNDFKTYTRSLPGDFERMTLDLFRHIKTGNKAAMERSSRELSDVVLAGINFEGIKHLTIIPDEKLYAIPFELLKRQNELLINNMAISYRYNSHIFRDHQNDKIFDPEHFVAFAPVFDDDIIASIPGALRSIENQEDEDQGIFRNDDQLKALPATLTEIQAIATFFKEHRVEKNIFTRNEANKQNFIANSSNADVLHIATHGYSHLDYPANSGLFFYNTKGEKEANGFLFAGEINDLEINADLVVLSACKSGYGAIKRGEGMMGVSRGFLYAGINNAIASLWKVHDEKTKDLMVAFYKHLFDGNSYVDALRLAKIDCIEKGYLPMDWAGFVLIAQ